MGRPTPALPTARLRRLREGELLSARRCYANVKQPRDVLNPCDPVLAALARPRCEHSFHPLLKRGRAERRVPKAPMACALDAVVRMERAQDFRRPQASAQRSARDGASGCFVLSRVLTGHPRLSVFLKAG